LLSLLACWGEHAYIVEGTVVEVHAPVEVVLDHKEVQGLMGPMIMPFEVAQPSLLEGLEPGHQVVARFELGNMGGKLTKLRITGKVAPPKARTDGPNPVWPGRTMPTLDLPIAPQGSVTIGEGAGRRMLVSFLYTRCPLPEYCPAVVARLLALQEAMAAQAHLVTVTLDPEHDDLTTLLEFSEKVGADPTRWSFARLEQAPLGDLLSRAALPVTREGELVQHGLRLLVIDEDGTLIERYDDNRWPMDRVLAQLATGLPKAPPGSHGTATPDPG
jgi:protein SCO1/2